MLYVNTPLSVIHIPILNDKTVVVMLTCWTLLNGMRTGTIGVNQALCKLLPAFPLVGFQRLIGDYQLQQNKSIYNG